MRYYSAINNGVYKDDFMALENTIYSLLKINEVKTATCAIMYVERKIVTENAPK